MIEHKRELLSSMLVLLWREDNGWIVSAFLRASYIDALTLLTSFSESPEFLLPLIKGILNLEFFYKVVVDLMLIQKGNVSISHWSNRTRDVLDVSHKRG